MLFRSLEVSGIVPVMPGGTPQESDTRRQVREQWAQGRTARQISRSLDLSHTRVYQVLARLRELDQLPEQGCTHPHMTHDVGKGTSSCPDCGLVIDPFEGVS